MPEDERQLGRTWFHWYVARIGIGIRRPRVEGTVYACPCCGYPTMDDRGGDLICLLCRWQDDGQDNPYEEEIWGGPNYSYSLEEARRNFQAHLSKYRLTDEELFRREAAKNDRKRDLMEIYERIRSTADDAKAAYLWEEARELYASLRRTIC